MPKMTLCEPSDGSDCDAACDVCGDKTKEGHPILWDQEFPGIGTGYCWDCFAKVDK